ncbi:MAG: hypothetical protein AB1422_11165 [bacterium]
MQQKIDTERITRDNLNNDGFSQIISDETIWGNKKYNQWKMELLWWLVKYGNISSVKENEVVLLLNRFSDEHIPVYFKIILEMVVFHYKVLPTNTTELAVKILSERDLRLNFDEHKRIVNKSKELPDHLNKKIKNLLSDVQLYAPSKPRMASTASIGDLFTPDNITILTALISATIGITTTTIKGIKLWLDERASRRIKIKHKDFEVEIQGAISEEELRKKLAIAKEIREELNKDNVQIIVSKDK